MISLFFDSEVTYDEYGMPVYDRPNNAEQLRETFASFLSNGIVSTRQSHMGSELGFAVQAKSGMEVSVNAGMCWINGACGWNKEASTVMLDAGENQMRIDIVVLRLDLRQSARNIEIFVRKGTPGADPSPPLLQRDSSVHELCLAEIKVPARSSVVLQANISDTRLDSDLCGIVTGLVKQIDSTELYRQVQSDLLSFKQTEQAEFLEWYDGIKNILDESTAGNLLALIQDRVPTTRTVNGKALSSNITLTVNDIGANNIFLAAHPVGSIYITTVATNPGTLFGGTWVAWGSGRVPVGVNTSDTDFNTVNKTGGSKTGRHNFKIAYQSYYGTGVGGDSDVVRAYKYSTGSYADGVYEGASTSNRNNGLQAGATTESVAFHSSTGDTDATSIVQPYITCYMWRRTV